MTAPGANGSHAQEIQPRGHTKSLEGLVKPIQTSGDGLLQFQFGMDPTKGLYSKGRTI